MLNHPGLEMDVAIAEAMGAVWLTTKSPYRFLSPRGRRWDLVSEREGELHRMLLPHYSTDRTAAMEIVDELNTLEVDVILRSRAQESSVEVYIYDTISLGPLWVYGPPATALPLAICHARLHPDVVAWVEAQRAEGGAT